MKLTIFIYEQVPLIDFVIPYDLLKDIPNIEIKIVSYLREKIPVAGKEVFVSDIVDIDNVESTDVLWICGSDAIHDVIKKSNEYETGLRRLIDCASTVVAISEGTLLLGTLNYLSGINVACPQKYHRFIKRLGGIIKKEMTVLDGKFITVESHAHLFELSFAISKLLTMNQGNDDLKEDWCYAPKFLYKKDELPNYGIRAKALKNHLNKVVQGNEIKMLKISKIGDASYESGTIKGLYDITFYLFDQMRAIDFAITYEILRHFPNVRIRCVSDRRGTVCIEGNGFKVVTLDAIQDVTHTNLLVIGGGEEGIISELNHGYLVHWLERICEGAQRVLTIGDGIRYLGVSGILTRYENYIDWTQPLQTGKYMIAETLTEAIDALLILAKSSYGDKHAKALHRFIAYGCIQDNI